MYRYFLIVSIRCIMKRKLGCTLYSLLNSRVQKIDGLCAGKRNFLQIPAAVVQQANVNKTKLGMRG